MGRKEEESRERKEKRSESSERKVRKQGGNPAGRMNKIGKKRGGKERWEVRK